MKLEDSPRIPSFSNKMKNRTTKNPRCILPIICSPERLSVKFLEQYMVYGK